MAISTSWCNQRRMYIAFHQFLFLMTGLATTLGSQWLFYKGAATSDSYLVQLAQYSGMVLVGLLVPMILRTKRSQKAEYTSVATLDSEADNDSVSRISMDILDEAEKPDTEPLTGENTESEQYIEGPIRHKSVMKLATLDVLANFCVTFGFAVIGSGMYQVIYSSVVIWCAILTYFLMGRKLSKLQWFAIFGTSAGLAVSSLGNFGVQTDQDASEESQASTAKLMIGTLATMCGTFMYSCVYVYSDYIMSKHTPSPLPARVCFTTGCYATVLSLIWISGYTLPQFDKLIHIQENVSTSSVLGMFALVMISNALHSWNYYELIERTGNVATGILQGLRAILVFILSDVWYCASDNAQCFTVYKGCGSLLVIGCVLLFTVGGSQTKKVA